MGKSSLAYWPVAVSWRRRALSAEQCVGSGGMRTSTLRPFSSEVTLLTSKYFVKRGPNAFLEHDTYIYIYVSIPYTILTLFVLLSPARNSHPGSHRTSLFSTTVRVLHFCREKDSAPSLYVNLRGIESIHSITGALDNWCHLRIKNSTRRCESMIPRCSRLTGATYMNKSIPLLALYTIS